MAYEREDFESPAKLGSRPVRAWSSLCRFKAGEASREPASSLDTNRHSSLLRSSLFGRMLFDAALWDVFRASGEWTLSPARRAARQHHVFFVLPIQIPRTLIQPEIAYPVVVRGILSSISFSGDELLD